MLDLAIGSLDTFSDLLFAISGAIASFAVDYPLAEQAPEIAVGTARPQIPPVPAQGGAVFGLFSKRLSEMTSNTASQLNVNVFALPGDQKLKPASPFTTERVEVWQPDQSLHRIRPQPLREPKFLTDMADI